MTPEGEFRDAAGPVPAGLPGTWLDRALARIGGAAMLLTVAAGGFVLVALAILFLGLLLPFVIGAGLIAFGSLWWRMRRMRSQGIVPPDGVPPDGSGRVRFVVIRR